MELVKKYWGVGLLVVVAIIIIRAFSILNAPDPFDKEAQEVANYKTADILVVTGTFLFYVALIGVALAAIFHVIKNPKGAIRFGIVAVALGIIFMIAKGGASTDISTFKANNPDIPLTSEEYQKVGGMASMLWILLWIAGIALVGLELFRTVKSRFLK